MTEKNNTQQAVPDDWKVLLEEFDRRVSYGRSMGGESKLEKRQAQGKYNAREMIALLVDDNSFMEIGTLAGSHSYHEEATVAADALVGGLAKIDGQCVVVACEDFTSKGGSIGHATNAKRVRLARLALQERVPYISLLEGSGERVSNALDRYPNAPNDLQVLSQLSGQVPMIAVVVGASAGHGALTGLMKDFVIMTEDACMFSAGPPLVEMALGEKVSKEELGAAAMHATTSGVCHNIARDCEQAFSMLRHYLQFLPANAYSVSAKTEGDQTCERSMDGILNTVPRDARRAYDMKKVLADLVDDESDILEIQASYGKSMITALSRIGGYAVGIVANQPTVLAGSIDAAAADKAAHFIHMCNAFHLPVVFLADNPGIMSGTAAEREGTLRAAASMYTAQSMLQSAKLHVTFRKAFGFGSSLMAMNPFDQQTLTFAFPGITLGGIPSAGGGLAAKVDMDVQQQLQEAEASGAWIAGDAMAYDEIIDPRELRNVLIRGLTLCRPRIESLCKPVSTVGIRPR